MIIPHEMLEESTLTALIEEFVTRDGTDLADAEAKVQQVRRLLGSGKAIIHFDEEAESCTIVLKDPPRG